MTTRRETDGRQSTVPATGRRTPLRRGEPASKLKYPVDASTFLADLSRQRSKASAPLLQYSSRLAGPGASRGERSSPGRSRRHVTNQHNPMSDVAPAAFTVVIPAYNPGPFLTEALESVARQTVQPAWVVVVDDGSTDGTFERATRLLADHALPGVVLRQVNQGISATRNAGIAAGKTDWIALLDADDLWLPTHLEQLRAAIAFCPDAVVAAGDSRFFGDARSRTDLLARTTALKLSEHSPAPGFHILSDKVFDELLPGLFIPVSASAFRMSGEPAPRFDLGLRSGEDRYFFLQMSRRGRFVFTEEQISRTRRHEHNTTHHYNAARLHEDLVTLLTKIDRSSEFALSATQREVVRDAAVRATSALMYSSSCNGLANYLKARRHAAPYLPDGGRVEPRNLLRAVAISLGLKKPPRAESLLP